jgi:serine/threonine protein kinase
MESEDPWIGRLLSDRYRVTSAIGRGGMATVYCADDIRLNRQVAVKIFAPGAANVDVRLRSEMDLLARLNHPNLVTLHDAHLAGADSGMPSFLVMELVDGPDLRSTLDRGPLRGHVSALIACDIAEALVAVHALGVVHRDLKPANILLVPTGLPSPTHRAKLADFGIAHLVGADRITTVGTVIGTASYLSPEQAAGGDPGPESDIYALGLVLLECLTGKRAYPGTIVEAMSARLDHDPFIPGAIPEEWASLLSRMTAHDPALRPTAVEVAVQSRAIAGLLDEWTVPVEEGERGDTETQAMLAPTQVLPASASVRQASASASPSAPRTRRRLLTAILVGLAAVAIVLVFALTPLFSASRDDVKHTPAISTTPSSVATTVPSQTPVAPVSTTPPKDVKVGPADKGPKAPKGPGKNK